MDWSFWDVLWTTFVVFLWISVLIIYFNVVVDIFRSHDLSGWAKTGWLIVLIVLPLLGLFIYTVARGPGMAERARRDGVGALRLFFERLLVRGYRLHAVPVAAGIDVDRPADVRAAETFLKQVGA